MSSNDRKKQQTVLDTNVGTNRNLTNNLVNEMIVPTTQNLYNQSQNANATANKDYGDIMGEYKNTLSKIDSLGPTNVTADLVNYSRSPEMQKAMSGFSEFADNGGYNTGMIQDLRARGVSPIRSAYQNALNDMARRVNVQGGYAPNANVLRAKMARESGSQMADAMQNVNAGIAERQVAGRQFGIAGLGDLSVKDTGFAQNAALANQAAKLQAAGINASQGSPMNQRLAALSGMSSLYSATPGQAALFGNQLLDSTQNWLSAQGQLSGLGNQQIQGQNQIAQMPTGFQAGLNNVGRIAQIGANAAGTISGMGSLSNVGRTSRVYDPEQYYT